MSAIPAASIREVASFDDKSNRRIQRAIETAGVSPFAKVGLLSFKGHLGEVAEAFGCSGEKPVGRKAKPSWTDVYFNLGAADGAVHIEDMVRLAEAAMREAKSKLDSAFSAAGIVSIPAIHLSMDSHGQLTVDAHPQGERVRRLFRDDPDLEENVRSAMWLKENAVSWRKAAMFTEMYQNTYRLSGKAAAEALSAVFLSLGNARSSFRYDASGFTALFDGLDEGAYLETVRQALGVHRA